MLKILWLKVTYIGCKGVAIFMNQHTKSTKINSSCDQTTFPIVPTLKFPKNRKFRTLRSSKYLVKNTLI